MRHLSLVERLSPAHPRATARCGATANGQEGLRPVTATRGLAPRALLEQIAEAEVADRATRNLQRLLKQARIGRFKPISDFDWDWPKKIDRELIERALTLDFISEARNLILLGANGLGKPSVRPVKAV